MRFDCYRCASPVRPRSTCRYCESPARSTIGKRTPPRVWSLGRRDWGTGYGKRAVPLNGPRQTDIADFSWWCFAARIHVYVECSSKGVVLRHRCCVNGDSQTLKRSAAETALRSLFSRYFRLILCMCKSKVFFCSRTDRWMESGMWLLFATTT